MCVVCYGATFNQYWYIEDNAPIQTTCTTGGDIILPTPPTKYGYDFVGWEKTYVPIEYLESTGTQWIDTGVRGNMSYTYEIDFQQTDNKAYRIWGLYSPDYTSPSMALTYNPGVFVVRWQSVSGPIDIDLSYIDAERHAIKIKNGFVNWDNVDKGRTLGHKDNFIFGYNLFLGTVNPGGSLPSLNSHSKYYSYKVWDSNDVLIQDFIPVLDPSGVPCMFDKVERKFYYNAGTGDFIAGPVIGE